MRVVVIIFLIMILASLGSAFYYLVKDKGQSERTVRALTIRIALSIALFSLLMLGSHFGIIPVRGL